MSALDDDLPIESLGMDSMTAVQVMTELRRRSGKELDYSLLFEGLTLAGLEAAISDESPRRRGVDFDLSGLSGRLQGLLPMPSAKAPDRPHDVFLTGATGFLGGYLLRELLSRTSGCIHCLVRASDEAEGRRRLRANLAHSSIGAADSLERVKVVVGDLGSPGFGLDEPRLERLAQTVDSVVHNAAGVNFVASYEVLRQLNVDPVFPLLDLVRRGKPKRLHFVSTLAVFNSRDRDAFERMDEGLSLASGEGIFSGYAQSKWVAEYLLRQAAEAGLQLTLHRPAMVTGDQHGRYFHADDFLSRFIKGCIQLGRYPDVNVEIDMTPVDYVAAGIASVVADQPTAACLHYANPNPMQLTDIFRWFSARGYALKPQLLSDWLRHLSNHLSADNALYSVAPFLTERDAAGQTILEFLNDRPWHFGTTRTRAVLEPRGLSCPTLDEKLLETTLNGFRKQNFLE